MLEEQKHWAETRNVYRILVEKNVGKTRQERPKMEGAEQI
jgi:hypothetical protein